MGKEGTPKSLAVKKSHRCKAQAKSGKPCQAAATAGGLCFFHANPNKASELGRIGGRSNRGALGETADPLPTLDNVLAVRDTVARLIMDVHSGKTHPKIAASLAPLLNLQLRAIEMRAIEQIEDLGRRLAHFEKREEEARSVVEQGAVKSEVGDLPTPIVPGEHERSAGTAEMGEKK